MATFTFELVAPERVLFSGAVDAVVLPASEGDMTVLAGHAPTMTALKTGFLVITDKPGNGRRILVRGGFADVNQSGRTRPSRGGADSGDSRPRDPHGRDAL